MYKYVCHCQTEHERKSYRTSNVDVALVTDEKFDTLDVTSGRRRQQRNHSFLHVHHNHEVSSSDVTGV